MEIALERTVALHRLGRTEEARDGYIKVPAKTDMDLRIGFLFVSEWYFTVC